MLPQAPRTRLNYSGVKWTSLVWGLAVVLLPASRALEYQDHRSLTAALKKLAADHSDIVRLKEQAVTAGKHELWLLELGTGTDDERKRRPALLAVAGIEGNDLVGTVSLVQWAERLAAQFEQPSPARSLLESTTLYIFPRMNPDAAESYFARPRVERFTNDRPVDEDHDGLVDEDGFEDLNADGLISSMRVQDPEGEYILDPADPRVLIQADRTKGERGAWKLLSEGIDNDKDEQWNEDGPGGVNLNRNFPYHYAFFEPWAGPHQVSEIETRALADFFTSHPNIGITFTFGAADNLVQTPKSEPGGKRPPVAISDADAGYYRELGQAYRESLGLKKELTGSAEPGTFSDWVYYHRGRLGLAAKPWTPALQIELEKARKPAEDKAKQAKEDSSKAEPETKKSEPADKSDAAASPDGKKAKDDKAAPVDKRGEDERAALKWFEQNAPEAFIPWKEFKHPDFPNQKVEIGGWAPFVRNNPPAKLLNDLTERQAKFLTDLAGKLPRIGFRKATAKSLGSGVYELTVQIENTGYLPTALAQGALTREVLRTRLVLKLEDRQILAGQRITLLGPLPGSGGMEELRYILRAEGPVELELISALGGSVQRTIELKEAL